MNKKKSLYALFCLLILATVASCSSNNDDSTSYSTTSYTSTLVSVFTLGNNDDVCYNLDSVFFAIDQDNCLIYNADSLPKGTDVTHLTVSMTFPTTVGSAQFKVKNGTVMKDTTFNYSSETTDSIDFTGDVKLDVKSYDGTKERVYTIKVNVHKMEPDSLSWNQSARRDLPSISGNVTEQKTVQMGSNYYCFMNEGSKYTIAEASNPGQGTWTKQALSLAFTPQVKTFTATDDALYVLDENGKLYKTSDKGTSWTDCGVTWSNILGGYSKKVLGVFVDGGVFKHDEYPRDNYVPVAVDDSFPVNQSSPFTMAVNKWTVQQQGMLVGGVAKGGERVSGTWGYDGTRWGLISNRAKGSLPALREPSIVSYYTFERDSTNYEVSKHPTWLLFGGRKANGALSTTVYISYDQGISWSKGGTLLQMPSYIPAFYGAQAFVVDETLKKAPRRGRTTPLTEWTCPYIYLVGGYDASDNVLNNIWKGVINRFTNVPIY